MRDLELALALETHDWAESSPSNTNHDSELELKALAFAGNENLFDSIELSDLNPAEVS